MAPALPTVLGVQSHRPRMHAIQWECLELRCEDEFRAAMAATDINTSDDMIADGNLQRFHVDGDKPGTRNGWYVLHGDGIPAGTFGTWKDPDTKHTWCAKRERELSPQGREANRTRFMEAAKLRDAERTRVRSEAACEARRLLEAATIESGDHKYLRDKGVNAYGDIHTNGLELLIPARDVNGVLRTLQKIRADGSKRFLTGGGKRGYYFAMGKPKGRIIVCEGYATGATIHEATDDAVAVAFDCGNLKPTAMALHSRYPEHVIVVAADDDIDKEVNAGVDGATAAALAVGGLLAIPYFGAERPSEVSDFNDLAAACGLREVARQIDAASRPSEPSVSIRAGVRLVKASDIEPEPVHWLWLGYLARGALHIIAGAPGTGKTTCALAFMATVSAGARWPDGSPAPCGHVVIWSGEDRAADTLVPRLMAAGADLDNVHFVTDVADGDSRRPFDPATDLSLLRTQLEALPDVRLMVVDSVVSAVAGDGNKNNDVRRGLQPLVDLAQGMQIAVVGISHYSKGTRGRDPVERVTGSIAYGALARVVLGTGKSGDADSPNVLTRAKSNLGPDGGGFEYRLSVVEVREGISASRVEWGTPLDGTAGEILGACEADPDERAEGQDAEAWLEEFLAGGPMAAMEVKAAAQKAGYAWRTVQRVRERVGIETKRDGFGPGAKWSWYLHRRQTPPIDAIGAKELNVASMAPMAPMGSAREDF